MSESDPIDLSNLQSLQFRPSWAEDLAKSDAAAGEVIWGRAPGGAPRDERQRPGGGPRREGGRGFDRNDRGPRPGPGQDRRGPRPDFRGGPPAQGDRRPPPRTDGPGPPRGEQRDFRGPDNRGDNRGPRPERRDFAGPRRDDRGPQGGRPPFRGGGERRDFRGPSDYRDRDMPPPLEGWNVSLIPDHRSVEAIARQIKASGRAFSVFDVGRLFMESRDRYQVRFNRRQAPPPQKGQGQEGAPAPAPARGPEELFQCVADGSLWLSRDEAVRHVLQSPALTKYYRAETVTHEAPKGNWTAIAVCGFSGTLLGPPNHHDFQRNVARLHRERFSDMPLERFKSRIRTEKDEALLQKWQESQSTATQYVPVTEEPLPEGAEPPAPLKSVSEMEAHFLRHHSAAAAVPLTKATVPGNIPGKFLAPPLLGLLRTEVERQQRFPMQLVQDLCRDLEGQGLRFFKRDKKTTFVCRNRPHFLPDDMVLSDRIRAMVEMVRANPGITYSRLVRTLAPHIVAFVPPRPAEAPAPAAAAAAAEPSSETAAPVVEAEAPAAPAPEPVSETVAVVTEEPVAEAPAADSESEASAPPVEAAADVPATEPAWVEGTAAPEPEAPIAETEAPSAEAETPVEAKAADTPEAAAPPAPTPTPAPAPAPAPAVHLSPEEIAILQDLHWLVQEGYVTEFQNGELFVLGRPPQPPMEKKPRPPKPAHPAPGADSRTVEQTADDAGVSVEEQAPVPAAEEVPAVEEMTTALAEPAEEETPTAPETPVAEDPSSESAGEVVQSPS